MRFFWIGLLVSGCTRPVISSGTDSGSNGDSGPTVTCENEGDTIDVRGAFPNAPEPGIELRAPSFEVPPYSEGFWCYYGTYTGPTVGVTWFEPLQTNAYSHHNLLRNVTDGGMPDGTMMECPPTGDMYDYAPLFEGVGVQPSETATNWLEMPEGVAIQFQEGQKYVLDMHYINPTGCTMVVQNGANIGTIDLADVEQWAAPIRMDGGIVEIPSGEAATLSYDCEFPTDMTVLSVGGHMHEHGTSYEVDWVRDSGEAERIYEIDPWDEEYRDFPILANFDEGELDVEAGDAFRTYCNWFNETESLLTYPEEMCTTFVVAYPLERALSCVLGEYTD